MIKRDPLFNPDKNVLNALNCHRRHFIGRNYFNLYSYAAYYEIIGTLRCTLICVSCDLIWVVKKLVILVYFGHLLVYFTLGVRSTGVL